MMKAQPKTVERFYSLDVLRGIAALAIVLWHWQHFFFVGIKPGKFVLSNLPLVKWLLPFYTQGWMAVDLFFCLSGFIFYWLYSQRIANGSITFGRFALLRFSRLYPLHFVTLITVALLQFWFIKEYGSYFVYSNNDVNHFILNLLFISSWGLERGYSFNGPIWSVSIEVFLYILFFVLSKRLPVRASFLVIFAIVGFVLMHTFDSLIGRGIGSFFLGGCLFFSYKAIVGSHYFNRLTKLAIALASVSWIITFVISLSRTDLTLLSIHNIPFLSRFDHYFHTFMKILLNNFPMVFLFPITILALSLAETYRGTLGKRISYIGDISYSSYLLHFPLQFAAYILVAWFGFNVSIYYSPLFMGLFYVVLIAISLTSYHFLEVPAQRFLRKYGASLHSASQGEKRR